GRRPSLRRKDRGTGGDGLKPCRESRGLRLDRGGKRGGLAQSRIASGARPRHFSAALRARSGGGLYRGSSRFLGGRHQGFIARGVVARGAGKFSRTGVSVLSAGRGAYCSPLSHAAGATRRFFKSRELRCSLNGFPDARAADRLTGFLHIRSCLCGIPGPDGYGLVSGMRLNALDWLNFFLADVRGGLGAYVNVFLLTNAHWSQAAIGAVLSTSGLIGIMAHPAVGAFIDRTRAKRALIIAGAFVLSGCGLAIVWMPVLTVVLVADIIMAVLGGVFAPTVAAITLGLDGREALPARLGRNAAFDRAGNVFIAAFIGVVGVAYSQEAPFYLAPLFAALTAIAALSIPARAIDHDKARGLEMDGSHDAMIPTGWRVLIRYRPLLVF